jgi:SNF2 family DNA or RNA helicase
MSVSLVHVESGLIRVETFSFADMLICQRLGGRYRQPHHVWVWPATEANARKLKDKLHLTCATAEFEALIPGADSPAASEAQGASASAGTSIVAAPPVAEPTIAIPETDVTIPDGLLTSPWKHQRAAFKFCTERIAAGFHGLLLAMGMGTGKSLVACMLILALGCRRVLIACPLRVVPVWVTQFERHVGAPVAIVTLDEEAGSVAEKQKLAAEKMRLAEARGIPFICVINYDGVWRDPFAAWAEKIQWDAIFADECHRLKSHNGKTSLCFKRLRRVARYRFGLSGTPMPHNLLDIFGPFRFLDITIYGPAFGPFKQKFSVMGGYKNKQIVDFKNQDELRQLMSRITFRVGKEVLDLPPETSVTYYCELTGGAARVYHDLYKEMVAGVKEGVITAKNAMVKVLRLAQIIGGCVPTDDGVEVRIDTAKLQLLADTLEDIGDEEPVAVFCWFHADMNGVHETCAKLGLQSLELSGRRDELKRWQDGEAQVLAVQIQAGGEGVDFTRARYSIFYSVGYQLAKYEQAKARVHRPGQTRPVQHIHLLAKNTVDVKIMRALERRADVIESLLSEIKNS